MSAVSDHNHEKGKWDEKYMLFRCRHCSFGEVEAWWRGHAAALTGVLSHSLPDHGERMEATFAAGRKRWIRDSSVLVLIATYFSLLPDRSARLRTADEP